MTHNAYVMGVDIGTTNTKAVLFSRDGRPIAKHRIGYPLYTPTPSTAQQDPEQIFHAVIGAIKQAIIKSSILPKNIMCVAFSAVMHSLIAVDKDGNPLTKCITWADNRSLQWAEKIKQEMNGHNIYLRTGTPIHPMSPLSKIIWLSNKQVDIFSKANKFISIKEYVFFKLFRQYIIDYSLASATGMLNLEKLDWDEKALHIVGITRDQLSKLVPTTHCIEGLDEHFAEETGLLPSTPFVIGASDGVLSNLGVNAIKPGVVAITIGTSGAIRTVVNCPVLDTKERTFCYALTENQWVVGGAVNNGGIAFRWIHNQFAASEIETVEQDSYDALTKIAEGVSPGSDGLIFHPYLAGERAPLWNVNARGSFFGLAMHHKKEHMIRAVLEGVIFNLYTVFLVLEELIGTPKKIQATGGFARSKVWRQMMADIFNREIIIPENYESSCLGAAVLGLYAMGKIDSLNIVSDMVGATHHHIPIKENVQVYNKLKPIYIRLPHKLEEDYESIANFQNNT